MPLEIRELVIKTTITDQHQKAGEGMSEKELNQLRKSIIADCMDKVMEELNKTKER